MGVRGENKNSKREKTMEEGPEEEEKIRNNKMRKGRSVYADVETGRKNRVDKLKEVRRKVSERHAKGLTIRGI